MNNSYPLVSIIVVNYNGKHLLKDCFDSLREINYPKDRLEIFMVDNCSADGSVEFIRESYPEIKIIENSINNYCAANNLGIRSSRGEYVALLNSDTKVDKNWLVELVKVISVDDKIAAAGSKILFWDGRIQSVGHIEFPNYYWGDNGLLEEDKHQYNQIREAESVSNCSALYRRNMLDEVGLFDEDFEMYMEDVDMAFRLKKNGWKILFVPESQVYHRLHGSQQNIQEKQLLIETNRILFVAKHFPEKLGDAFLGNGYFTVLNDINNKNDIYNILPSVFLKLFRHHQRETIENILSDLFASLKKINQLEKHYLIGEFNQGKQELLRKQVLLEEKDAQIRQAGGQLQQKIDALSAKEKELVQKDGQIRQTGWQLQQKIDALSAKEKELVQKDDQIKQTSGQLQQKIDALSAKEKELVQKDGQIKIMMQNLRQMEERLKLSLEETDSLRNRARAFYGSETFKFIVQPVWTTLGFLKKIKKFLISPIYSSRSLAASEKVPEFRILCNKLNSFALGFMRFTRYLLKAEKISICFSVFSAKSASAVYKTSNQYILKIANNTELNQAAMVLIEVCPLQKDNASKDRGAYFSKSLFLHPKGSTEIVIEYNWLDEVNFFIKGASFGPDNLWHNRLEPREQFYSIDAVLYDNLNCEKDRLTIYQGLKKCG